MNFLDDRLVNHVRSELERLNADRFEVKGYPVSTPVIAIVRCWIGEQQNIVPVTPHRSLWSPELLPCLLPLQHEVINTNAMLRLAVENGDMATADTILHELTRTSVLGIPI